MNPKRPYYPQFNNWENFRDGIRKKKEPPIRSVSLAMDRKSYFEFLLSLPPDVLKQLYLSFIGQKEQPDTIPLEPPVRKNACLIDYSSGFILGVPIIYTDQLINPFSLPDGVRQYELVNGSTCPWILMEAADSDGYSSFGTVLSLTPIPLGRYGLRQLQEYAVDLDGRALTLQEYLLYGM